MCAFILLYDPQYLSYSSLCGNINSIRNEYK